MISTKILLVILVDDESHTPWNVIIPSKDILGKAYRILVGVYLVSIVVHTARVAATTERLVRRTGMVCILRWIRREPTIDRGSGVLSVDVENPVEQFV